MSEHLDLTVNYQAAAYTVPEGQQRHRHRYAVCRFRPGTGHSHKRSWRGLGRIRAITRLGVWTAATPWHLSQGESSKAFTITANSDADTDDETLDLGFGTLPDKVTAGATVCGYRYHQ